MDLKSQMTLHFSRAGIFFDHFTHQNVVHVMFQIISFDYDMECIPIFVIDLCFEFVPVPQRTCNSRIFTGFQQSDFSPLSQKPTTSFFIILPRIGVISINIGLITLERQRRILQFFTPVLDSGISFCRNLEFQFQRSEEHTSELQSRENLVCRLLLEKKKARESTASRFPIKIASTGIQ